VEKALFSISCTTCQARLTVRNESAIGAILECPKCGSMVLVTPPKGWVSKAAAAAAVLEPEGKAPAVGTAAAKSTPVKPLPDGVEWADAVSPILIEPPKVAVPPAVPPPAPVAPLPVAPAVAAGLMWNKWALLGGLSLFALIVGIGAWAVFGPSSGTDAPDDSVAEKPEEPPVPDQPSPPQGPGPARIDRRWLPDQTALLVSFSPSLLAAEPKLNRLFEEGDDLWRQTCGPAVAGLGFKRSDIRRLTWVSADGADWRANSLVIVQLEPTASAAALGEKGEAAGFSLFNIPCRRLPKGDWPHPLAVLDQWTVITGSEGLLRHLAARHEADLKSTSLKKLLAVVPADADATLLIDLGAARAAKWKLPAALFDIWPAGKPSWHVLWELPTGLGCSLQFAERLHGELALVCGNESNAQRTLAALTALLPAAKEGVTAQIKQLGQRLKEGQMTAAAAEHYEVLLNHAAAALKAARCELTPERVVRLRIDWSESPGALAAAALDSRPAIRGQWLAAGQEANALVSQRILSGVTGYRKAEGKYPIGAAGGVLLNPDTRLSWIATLLPYFDHADWHRKLEFGYSWNSPQNLPVARQTLPEVVNPLVGPESSETGFPATHYVGVAGVGADAGKLPADDPRAGMFGYNRHTRPEELSRGAANTIAVLGVTKQLGPWAAGGNATVRPLTKAPYVNGPDGFGSGQPNGMLVGMADGSVRFVGKDVSPEVFEQLATIRGNDALTVASLDPSAAKPKPKPVEPEVPAKDPPDGEPAKPAPGAVDIAPLLAQPVAAMELTKVPLGRAINLVAGMSTVPVSFDPDALADLEVTPSDPVTVQIGKTTLGKALGSIVAGRGLVCVAVNGQVLVTSPAAHREALVKRDYAVADLCGADAAASDELAAMIQKLVAPESWRSNGGRGTIDTRRELLSVQQTEAVQRRVLEFCEKLRTARGKPPQALDADRCALATRSARAKELLARDITLTFFEPTSLRTIVGYLEDASQADILVDGPALAAAKQPANAKGTLKVSGQPLSVALKELLQPLGLTYRVIDAATLQITSPKTLDARLELEFYPLAALLKQGQTPAALLERLRSTVAPATWSDAGGPGVLYFDRPSSCLIVLQSQPVQAAVEAFLAGKE